MKCDQLASVASTAVLDPVLAYNRTMSNFFEFHFLKETLR